MSVRAGDGFGDGLETADFGGETWWTEVGVFGVFGMPAGDFGIGAVFGVAFVLTSLAVEIAGGREEGVFEGVGFA